MCSGYMNEGKDYNLHTHTNVPGKCPRDMPPHVKQQRNKDHNALVTSMWKKDCGPRSSHWRHQTCRSSITGATSSNSIIKTTTSFRLLSQSFQLLRVTADSSVNGWHLFSWCTTAKQDGSCLWLAQISVLWQGRVAQSCTWWSWHLMQSSVAVTCPMKFQKLNSVLHVVGQILQKFHVTRVKKCQHAQEDVSLQHVPEIRPGNFFSSLPTQSTIWSLLHSPATCPLSVYLTRFCPRYILEQHVPATCLLVWTHLKEDNQGYNSVWLLNLNLFYFPHIQNNIAC